MDVQVPVTVEETIYTTEKMNKLRFTRVRSGGCVSEEYAPTGSQSESGKWNESLADLAERHERWRAVRRKEFDDALNRVT